MESPMKFPHLFLVPLLATCSTLAAGEPSSRLPVRLPQDQSSPVIVLDFDDHTPRSGRQPHYLAIYANGKAVVSSADGRGQRVTNHVPAAQLHEILTCLLVENQLLDVESSQLQRQIRAVRQERQRPQPGSDAATTVLRIRTAKGAHEIRCHAVGLTANQLPDLSQSNASSPANNGWRTSQPSFGRAGTRMSMPF